MNTPLRTMEANLVMHSGKSARALYAGAARITYGGSMFDTTLIAAVSALLNSKSYINCSLPNYAAAPDLVCFCSLLTKSCIAALGQF
jgi:hypothetical protein